MDLETIEREALALPLADRAKLAHELLESLDVLSEQETEALWLEVAASRAREIADGTVQPIPAEDVFREAEAHFR